jgi:hypothetical protein
MSRRDHLAIARVSGRTTDRPLDDVSIRNDDELIREISGRTPGSSAHLKLMRDGREQSVTLKLAERPARDSADARAQEPLPPSDRVRGAGDNVMLGLIVRDLDRQTTDKPNYHADARR